MHTEDPKQAALELMMSPTVQRLCGMATDCPVTVTDPEAIKAALSMLWRQMVQALDQDRIHFDRPEDAAMFHGLLVVALEVIFDGRFRDTLATAPIQ